MKKLFLVALISMFLQYLLSAQMISGKIIYKLVVNDSNDAKIKFSGTPLESNISFKGTYTLFVKDSYLISTKRKVTGDIDWIEFQKCDSVYLFIPKSSLNPKDNTIPYSKSLFGNQLEKLKLTGKAKETRVILGFECKEYWYSESNGMVFKVWIPDGFRFKTQYKNGKFFLNYFFLDGLAFRKEMHFEGKLCSTIELINLEIYDVPEEAFTIKYNDK